MGTWEIIGGIAAIVTIIGGALGATKAIRKWIKKKKHFPTLTDRIATKNFKGVDEVVDEVKSSIQDKNETTAIDSTKNYLDLSEEEVNVLLTALHSEGEIRIIEEDQTGKFLQIGNRDYYDINHPEIRISYLEALKRLIQRNHVFQETERWFNLTKAGFDYARSLEIDVLMEKAWDQYKNKKDFRKSIEIYRDSVEKHPKSGAAKEAQKMVGVNYLHLGDPINAEIELKKAINIGNEFSSAYFYYGEALLLNHKYKDAKAAFEIALSKPDVQDWIKSLVPEKLKRCKEGIIKQLSKLSDEKYELEKERIDKKLLPQEANLKEKSSLRGLRWSSVLARELLALNLEGSKKKLEARQRLDKEIVFSGQRIKTEDDLIFVYERLKAVAEIEKSALKERLIVIYKDSHANSFIETDKSKIDQEIDTLLKEKYTDLMIEKEQA